MDTVKALLKRQLVLVGDDGYVRMKTKEQLEVLSGMGESYERFHLAVGKLKSIQGEKHAILHSHMY